MAIVQVGSSSSLVTRTATGVLTASWPAGYSPVANDVSIVVIAGAPNTIKTTPTPSGYALIAQQFRSGTYGTEVAVFYKVLTGAESVPSISSNYSFSSGISVAIFRGCDPASPIDATGVGSTTASAVTFAPTGVTTNTKKAGVFSSVATQDDNNLGLDIGNEQGFGPIMSGVAYQLTNSVSTDFSMGLAWKLAGAPAAVTSPTWRQNANGNDAWVAVSFALKPLPITALGGATASGSAVRGSLTFPRTALGGAVAAGTAVSDISVLFQRTAAGSAVGLGASTIKLTTNRTALGRAFASGVLNATWQPNPGITPKTIDESAIDGPELIDTIPGLTPETIDASSPPTGPILPELFVGNPPPFNPGDPLPVRPAYVPYVYATFDDGTQLANAFNVSWTDPLNGSGAGQLSLPADDPQTALLVPGARIRCWMYGTPAFTFIVENAPETVLVSQQEELGEVISVKGRGWVAEYDTARIYPYGGTGHPLNPQQRTWSFATPNYPNLTGWRVPFSQGEQRYVLSPRNVTKERKSIVGEVLKDPLGQIILDQYGDRVPGPDSSVFTETIPWPAPMDWQVPAAHWIWGQANDTVEGYNYFRTSFTLTRQIAVTIAATADNYYTVFLDGIPIVGDSENHLCWQSWKYIEVVLEPGTYVLGAVVVNVPLSSNVATPPYPDIPGYVWIYDTTTQTWALVLIGGESLLGYPGGVFVGGPNRVVNGGGVVDGIYIPNGTFGPPLGGPMYQRLPVPLVPGDPGFDGTPIGGPEVFNPAGFVAAVYTRDTLNRLSAILTRTDGNLMKAFPLTPLDGQRYTWRCIAYPGVQPGWTVGQLIADIRSEAQARGNILDHTLAFTDLNDSDGNSWQGVQGGGSYIPGFSMAVGASFFNALDSLVDQGWIDYRMKAGTPQLQVWNQGGAGVSSGVVFTEGVNVASLSVRASQYIYDRLLVKYSGGFVSVGSNGREGYITVNSEDEEEALRRGATILADIQNPDPAVLLEVEPIAGSQPYLDFEVGDYVTVTGIGSLRVMAITVDQDDMGYPQVSLELNKRWPATERAEYNLLQSLGEGSVGKIRSDPMVVGLPAKIVI